MFKKKLLFMATTLLGLSPFYATAHNTYTNVDPKHMPEPEATSKLTHTHAAPDKHHHAHHTHASAISEPAPGQTTSDDIKVSIGGSFSPQYGSISQQSDFRNKTVGDSASDKLNSSGLATNTRLEFKVAGEASEIKYGGKVKIYADTSPAANSKTDIADKVMLFAEGRYGRFELGSYEGAHDRIKVSGYTYARATGGVDGDYSNWLRNTAYYINNTTNLRGDISSLFWDSLYLPTSGNKRSNKVTYYSPALHGLSFGISYVPDTDMVGTAFRLNSKEDDVVSRKRLGSTSVVEAGVRYENQFNNEAKLILSVMGEIGKPKKYSFRNAVGAMNLTRHDIRAVEFGAGVEYKGFTVSGSYANLGKSAAIKKVTDAAGVDSTATYLGTSKPKGSFWTIGSSYTYEDFGVSINYMQSEMLGAVAFGKLAGNVELIANRVKTRYDALVVGADYKILPGVLAYIEYTNFKYHISGKKNGVIAADLQNVKLNKGSIILTGVKLKF